MLNRASVFVVSALGAGCVVVLLAQQPTAGTPGQAARGSSSKRPGAVEIALARARNQGLTEAVVDEAIVTPTRAESLDDALRTCSLVLCTPVAKTTRWADPDFLSTYYTMRAEEILAKKYVRDPYAAPPADLASALRPGQLLVRYGGGTVPVGPITVRQPGPSLVVGQRYLIVASLEPGGLLARLEFPDSVYRVGSDGALSAMLGSEPLRVPEFYGIWQDLQAHGLARVDAIRQHLRGR